MLALEKPVGLDDNEEVDAEGDIRDGHPAYNRRNVSKEKKKKINKLLPRMARIPKTMPMRVTIIQGRVWPAFSFGLRASFGNDGNDDHDD